MKRYWALVVVLIFCGQTSGHPLSSNAPTKEGDLKTNSDYKPDQNKDSMVKTTHTYGMNLSNNRGFVWNGVGYKRPVMYGVGKPDTEKNDQPQKVVDSNGTPISNVPQILQELYGYEPLWKWLSQWGSFYLESLSNFLSETIKEEVSNEVKTYFNILETSDYIQKLDKINADRVRDQMYLEIKHKLIKEGLILEDKVPLNEVTKNDLKKELISLINEEVEILKDFKRGEENNKKDKDRPFKVEAEKIYGNSVGNQKVINIYVINPQKDINEVLEQIKPITDGEAGNTFTVGPQENIQVEGKNKERGNMQFRNYYPDDGVVIQVEDN